MESHSRTILKTITWRIIATIVVIGGVFYYSKDWNLAITSGLVAGLIKTFLYYFHERIWNYSNFGRETKRKS